MPNPESPDPSYFDKILKAYEGEVAGEAYFKALAGVFNEQEHTQKLALLAAVENLTSRTLLPLLKRYGIKPREQNDLVNLAHSWIRERAFNRWEDLINNMTTRYPGYIEEFKILAASAPDEDKTALDFLVEHEIVLLEFANQEESQEEKVETNPIEQIRTFLAKHQR